ncbi:preprotein translocase subunit SecE [Rhodococcoides kyotonense]|uniref:Protein translocase subunit SecE n=1 Tax=Rhodococcoides kyotonense TaxID=398843 RepID=A0A239MLB6_9NOCA|nr:preprotein translocase subunit SecE [Rhodococcus kyotonensis]SNT43491.1 preprotein translocase subunit SecE [Rhodococcus kyotonensis]
MSEERGKRDETSEDVSTSDSSTSDNAASPTDDAAGAATSTGGNDAPARPTGKRTTRRTRAVSIEKTPAAASATKVASRSEKPREPKRMNVFKRLRRFFREVVAELRKVIWPNRKQMVTYTSVVLVFVAFMVAFISGLDLAFIKGVGWLFG